VFAWIVSPSIDPDQRHQRKLVPQALANQEHQSINLQPGGSNMVLFATLCLVASGAYAFTTCQQESHDVSQHRQALQERIKA
jgi:hypothetical protein